MAADCRSDTISSLCRCTDRRAVHVHCFCVGCNGKAVNYRTQISHMKLNAVSLCDGDVESSLGPSQQVEYNFDDEGEEDQEIEGIYLNLGNC